MHYKNKREAKVGDKVLFPKHVHWDTKTNKSVVTSAPGIITSIQPGATSCNATVIPVDAPGQLVTLGHCLHVDDAPHLTASSDAEAVATGVPAEPPQPE